MESQKRAMNNDVDILIVEDSPTQAERLKYLLEEHGFRVTVAANGEQALAAARQRKPTLVVSDIVMPEMDGYTLCKAIRTDEALRDIPVVLVTALSSPQDVIKGLECGADNFIRKPYDEKYLLSRVESILANRELRKSEKVQMGVEIALAGEKHFITAERQQILGLLISTYQEAISLQEELERSYQTLSGLYRIAMGLNQATSEREVVETAVERALELPTVQAAWIALREGESGFRLAAARGLPPALEAPGALEGDCLCCRQLLSGEFQVMNIPECERLQKAKSDTRGLRSHASIPLRIGDSMLGVMNLAGPEQGSFRDEDLKLLNGVGNQIGVALDRARLYGRLEKTVKELEAANAQLEEVRRRAEEASQHKSAFLANMSHELRTPLNSILGFSEILQNQTFGPLNEKQARYVNHIWTSGQHLLAMINDLLDLSKVEAGKIALRPEAFVLQDTLATALAEIQPQADAKHLQLALTVEAGLPLLTADPIRFKQILYNLLSNAVKFTPEGGRVTVTAHRVPGARDQGVGVRDWGLGTAPPPPAPGPQLPTPGDFVEIAVVDTGIGFKAEDLPRLFQPFTQLEATASKRFQGTGLGLALTKHLVELHGGAIWAESQGEGLGSTFTVRLPLFPPG